MAEKKDVSQSGWQLTRVWLSALEETARDFHGSRPQEFCRRAYEHATEYWIKILESEFEIEVAHADTFYDALMNYINSGVLGGLFEDQKEFNIVQLPSGGVRIEVLQCPYEESCRDLLDRGITLKGLTCARLGCFRAACLILTKKDCTYEMHEVKPGVMCKGVIEPL